MEIKTKELAALLHGDLIGDGDAVISGFAKIEEACSGDLSFIANPKYARYASTTGATAILVDKNFEPEVDSHPTLIKVEDPYSALAMLMRMVESYKKKPEGVEQPVFLASDFIVPEHCYIGAFTYIGKSVEIGENSLIYPQVYIGENVTVGKDCIIYAGVKIYSGCKIGDRCIIHSGSVIGSDGFGFAPKDGRYEKIPQLGNVIIEDDVEIGANTTIDKATFGSTVIGKGTKLDNLIQIAHNVTLGENNVLAAQAGIAGSTKIGSGNRIGGQCGFAGHITVGNNNEFGAQSGIHTNIGDNKRMIGYPATDIMTFAKTSVYLRRLDELFKEHQKRKQK